MIKKITKKRLAEALYKSHGMITSAADSLGICRQTIYTALKEWPECQEEIDAWKVRRKDRAEYKLDEAIERGESWAIAFCLKNSERGYSDKLDWSGVGEVKITVQYEGDKDA
jgi:hypothetical protein